MSPSSSAGRATSSSSACSSDNADGMFGDLLATSLTRARRAWAWSSTPAAATCATLREMGFPVWSRAVSAKGTVKATLGAVNVPVVCAGALVHPGDVVDRPTTTASWSCRAAQAATVAAAAAAREANEEGKRARLAAGELGLDIYGMREQARARRIALH